MKSSRIALSYVVLAAAATAMFFAVQLHAQTPTAEQLRVFQSLPKDQRDAILNQMGVGSSGAAAVGRSGATIPNQVVVQQPAGPAGQAESSDDAREPRDRPIIGGEQLLIELALPSSAGLQAMYDVTPDGRRIARLPEGVGREEERSLQDQRYLTELRERILRRNPYALTKLGVLQLPGLEPIPLAGLTAREVQERLALDPMLRDFSIAVTVLRLQRQGRDALKPFGYDIFKSRPTAFVPGTDIPAPDDYRLGPGDVMNLQLYGQQAQTYTLPVGRDGLVNIPSLGPVSVGGMNFGAARDSLQARVKRQMIGTEASVTLSELRSARVLILGDAEHPGSYVVSSLSNVTNALFVSGGVKPIGSLRRIEVKRDGRLMRTLDLYDVLLRGDTADDVRLQTGDAVFVPPVGPTVAVEGSVKRPAIYELLKERLASDVVALAGGLAADADSRRVTVERIGDDRVRLALTLDLGTAEGKAFALRDGDIVRVDPIRPVLDDSVRVDGWVHRPGTYAWRAGMRLTDVVASIDELKPRADLHYVLVRREDPVARKVTVFSADVSAALAQPGSSADIGLSPRDQIIVFDLTSPRSVMLEPVLEDLARQSGPSAPAALVSVGGRVNAPGRYPLEPGMKISGLIRAGGGLSDAAFLGAAELTRYVVTSGERRRAELREVDLGAVAAGDVSQDIVLQPYDVLTVKEVPEWSRVEQVDLAGEVRFPGKYQIRRGETLRSVIERAGGLTPLAFPEGAALTREELKTREREQLDKLASRLQSEIAVLSLQGAQTSPNATQSLAAGQGLLEQLRQTRPVGRLVIDLPRILAPGNAGEADVLLRGGDRLVVPRLTQEVSVLGEVQNPTSHLFKVGAVRDDYIGLSGGTTPRADRGAIYVVRADGSVVGSRSRWFGRGNIEVRPGDTVVVPIDAEKMRPLPLWTAVSQIVYNLAIAATAVSRF